jgi:hypothetical protein
MCKKSMNLLHYAFSRNLLNFERNYVMHWNSFLLFLARFGNLTKGASTSTSGLRRQNLSTTSKIPYVAGYSSRIMNCTAMELSEVSYDPLAMKIRELEGVGAGNCWAQEGLPAGGRV